MNKLKLNILLVSFLYVGINFPVYSETVTVPSTASGGFGTPRDYFGVGWTPLVKALTVKTAGTITISYLSGSQQVPPPALLHKVGGVVLVKGDFAPGRMAPIGTLMVSGQLLLNK